MLYFILFELTSLSLLDVYQFMNQVLKGYPALRQMCLTFYTSRAYLFILEIVFILNLPQFSVRYKSVLTYDNEVRNVVPNPSYLPQVYPYFICSIYTLTITV